MFFNVKVAFKIFPRSVLSRVAGRGAGLYILRDYRARALAGSVCKVINTRAVLARLVSGAVLARAVNSEYSSRVNGVGGVYSPRFSIPSHIRLMASGLFIVLSPDLKGGRGQGVKVPPAPAPVAYTRFMALIFAFPLALLM